MMITMSSFCETHYILRETVTPIICCKFQSLKLVVLQISSNSNLPQPSDSRSGSKVKRNTWLTYSVAFDPQSLAASVA